MAPQQDLVKIGLEGFEIIDTFYGPSTRRNNNTTRHAEPRQGRWGVQAAGAHDHGHSMHKEKEQVMNSKDAAYKYGGIMVVNYPPKAKPHNRWGKIFQAFKP